jgi:hypothetical protein
MKHLGERVTSLADGQLDDNARDLALAHLARCAECQAAVERERAIKAALQALPDLAPTPAFVGSLLALAEPGGPLPPQRRPFPGAAPADAQWRTGGDGSRTANVGRGASRSSDARAHWWTGFPVQRGTEDAQPLRRRSTTLATSARLAVGGVVTVGALTAVLAALGGPESAPSSPAGTVVPPVQQFTIEHARSAGSLPFFEPASVAVTGGPGQEPAP